MCLVSSCNIWRASRPQAFLSYGNRKKGLPKGTNKWLSFGFNESNFGIQGWGVGGAVRPALICRACCIFRAVLGLANDAGDAGDDALCLRYTEAFLCLLVFCNYVALHALVLHFAFEAMIQSLFFRRIQHPKRRQQNRTNAGKVETELRVKMHTKGTEQNSTQKTHAQKAQNNTARMLHAFCMHSVCSTCCNIHATCMQKASKHNNAACMPCACVKQVFA